MYFTLHNVGNYIYIIIENFFPVLFLSDLFTSNLFIINFIVILL